MSRAFVPSNTTEHGDEDSDSNAGLFIILGGVALALLLFVVALLVFFRPQ